MTMVKKCITCPIGCDISISLENDVIQMIKGNECKRGEEYIRNEILEPKRILTSVVKAKGYRLPVVSVRTDKPIPKQLLFNCMEALHDITAKAPFAIGDVLVKNILNTNANIIITKR